MSGIAGTSVGGGWDVVRKALDRMTHRGERGDVYVEEPSGTLGEIRSSAVKMWPGRSGDCRAVCAGAIYNWKQVVPDALDVDQAIECLYNTEGSRFLTRLDGAFALAITLDNDLFLARDPLGIAPLYYGEREGTICFASEAKSLLEMTRDVRVFPPGHCYHTLSGLVRYYTLPVTGRARPSVTEAAADVRTRLGESVGQCLSISEEAGCWLSGGLDSSVVAALANLHSPGIHTFATGTEGAADLHYARAVARHISSQHHELTLDSRQLLEALPDVIYHLESFDALLVRSSLMNYMVARLASDYVPVVLSGEGGDELFAGYGYLAQVDPHTLQDELADITSRLHNTALQRVDRCSAASGTVAHVPFLARDVVNYAFSLPADYKLHRNARITGKWVLRRAADPLLPDTVVERPKAKFWEGAGVYDLIARKADSIITDSEFDAERQVPGGRPLASKEELLYYRVFRQHFGHAKDCGFVGRTKRSPEEDTTA